MSMSILDDSKKQIFYTIIHDWIVCKPSKHVSDMFYLNHTRMVKHVDGLAKGFLTMFYAFTPVNDFTILHNITMRRVSTPLETLYSGMSIYEEDMNQCEVRSDSELYYDELTQHDTRHGVYEVEALLEDNMLCAYPSAWIGYVYKTLWPFLSVGGELPPGVHSWANGKRTVRLARRIPLISQPAEVDDLYS
jgi:hypothetical protein